MSLDQYYVDRFNEALNSLRLRVFGNNSLSQVDDIVKALDSESTNSIRQMIYKSSWESIDRLKLIAASFLVNNANVLLIGTYGAGKTYVVKTAASLFGIDMFRVQGAVNTDASSFSGQIDVREILTNNNFKLIFPDYVYSDKPSVLFVDEINRMTPAEMNYMTTILAERKVDSEAKYALDTQDKMVEVKNLTVFATRNRQDSATFDIPYHMLDRFSVCLLFEQVPFGTVEASVNSRVLGNEVFPDVVEAKAQIGKTPFSKDAITFLDFFVSELSTCTEHGAQKEFVQGDPCSNCPKAQSHLCMCLAQDFFLSARAKEHILAYARVEAALEGKSVDIEHIRRVTFPALAHRMRLKPGAQRWVMTHDLTSLHINFNRNVDASTLPFYDTIYAIVKAAEDNALQHLNVLKQDERINRAINEFADACIEYAVAKIEGRPPEVVTLNTLNELTTQVGFSETPIERYILAKLMESTEAAREIVSKSAYVGSVEELEQSLSWSGRKLLNRGRDSISTALSNRAGRVNTAELDTEDLPAVSAAR